MTDPLASAARMRLESLLSAMEAAERIIVTLMEREREALRAGCWLAANAVHIRVNDAARLYINAIAAARAGLTALEPVLPEAAQVLESRRTAFGAVLRIELATLATTRMAANCHQAESAMIDGAAPIAFAL